MNSIISKLRSTYFPLSLLVISAFAFVVLLGLNFSMPLDAQGRMTACPIAGSSLSACSMNAGEHLTRWQGMFSMMPHTDIMLLMIILLGAVIFFVITQFIDSDQTFTLRYQRYKQDNPDTSLFNYLRLVLAAGILQPQIYA